MVIVASTLIAKCHGMHGVEVESTATIEQIDPAQYDGIVAVGGQGASQYLRHNRSLIDLLKKFNEQGKLVSAIGRARHALYNAGLFGTNFSREPEVEINGNVMTARPPKTTPGWTSKKYGLLLLKHLQES